MSSRLPYCIRLTRDLVARQDSFRAAVHRVADAARAVATLLLTSADLAEGHEASEVDGDDPTTYSRGDA